MLCVTCSYSYNLLPGIIAPRDECSREHSLPETKVPRNEKPGSEKSLNQKKCSEETQTLHAGCSKAEEPNIFVPPQTPFQFGEDQCTQIRVIMVLACSSPSTSAMTFVLLGAYSRQKTSAGIRMEEGCVDLDPLCWPQAA